MTPASRPTLRPDRGPGFWLGMSVDVAASLILPPGACASVVLLMVGHSLGLAPVMDRLLRVLTPAAA